MRIFIVCPRLCHGGAERVAVTLANGFAQRGYQVTFFSDLFEEHTYMLLGMVQVVNLVPKTHNKIKKWGCAIRILRKHLKKDKPDVIIGIMSLCSIVAKIASVGFGIPVVATEHNSYERPRTSPMSLSTYIYKYYISKCFDVVTILTEADKKVIGERLKNVVVNENPLALKPIEQTNSRKHILLAAGRVDDWRYKGFDVLIRAWGAVVESDKFKVQNEEWKLVIAGVWRNPETRTFLDGIAEECGIKDKIEYTGFVNDMKKLYSESSIFVLSSRYEAFGLVLIEAMSQGCACIACDYKGRQREIIQNESQGLCCEPDDVDSLAEAMKKMITDDDYRESVRKNAIERSKFYSIENTMDRWEELLTSVQRSKS